MLTDLDFKTYPENHFIDLNLFQLGHEKCKSTHVFGPVIRNHYLFHYVISGKGTLYADDKSGTTQIYKISANTGFMIFPNQVTTYFADKDEPWTYIWIEFDGIMVNTFLQLAGMSLDAPLYRYPGVEARKKLLDEMIWLVEHREDNPFQLTGHLFFFFDYLTQRSDQKRNRIRAKKVTYYLKEAVSFMENHYAENITVEDIANHCGLTRSYFGKIFKESYDFSPQEFLLRMRMTKATNLLLRSDMSIGEISAAVGYPDQFHFSKVFKNVFGISPRQWREQFSK